MRLAHPGAIRADAFIAYTVPEIRDCRGIPVKASRLIVLAAVATTLHLAASADEAEDELEGVVKIAAYDLPESAFLSEESRNAMKYFRDVYRQEIFAFATDCGDLLETNGDDYLRTWRVQEALYKSAREDAVVGVRDPGD